MKGLTPLQASLLQRARLSSGDGGRRFIILNTGTEDRTARSLEAKGLGEFVDNGWRYSWRSRDGYTNLFYPSDEVE